MQTLSIRPTKFGDHKTYGILYYSQSAQPICAMLQMNFIIHSLIQSDNWPIEQYVSGSIQIARKKEVKHEKDPSIPSLLGPDTWSGLQGYSRILEIGHWTFSSEVNAVMLVFTHAPETFCTGVVVHTKRRNVKKKLENEAMNLQKS